MKLPLQTGDKIMRLRRIAVADEAIEKSKYVVHAPESKRGLWAEVFGNSNPLHIEIGMGKGSNP